MAEKKYFWLKMPRNFFEKHYIKILRAKDNGDLLVMFYIWMLTESIDHEGRLRYSEDIPYDEEMLAEASGFALQIVTQALQQFSKLQLVITESDGTLFLPKSLKMIGSESASAQRVREYREREKDKAKTSETTANTESNNNVTECNADVQKGNTEKELELEKEKDIITDSKESVCRTEVQRVVDAWNSLSDIGIKSVSKMSSTSKRYKSLVARIKEYGPDTVIEAMEHIRNSDFLRGKNRNGWTITFDWFILPNNFPKVLDGNFDNQQGTQQRTGDAKLDRLYNRVKEVDNW